MFANCDNAELVSVLVSAEVRRTKSLAEFDYRSASEMVETADFSGGVSVTGCLFPFSGGNAQNIKHSGEQPPCTAKVYERKDSPALKVLLVLVFLPLLECAVEKCFQRCWVCTGGAVNLEIIKLDSGKLNQVCEFHVAAINHRIFLVRLPPVDPKDISRIVVAH